MAKQIYESESAVAKLLTGVDKVANTVKQTLGPRGRNIILQKKFGLPISCNDGVTIARDIVLSDKLENAGAQFLIEASKTTNDQAGDGTTSVCILAQTLIHEGFKAILDGKITATKLVDDLNALIPELTSYIKKNASPVKDIDTLSNVATISCGGDSDLGKLVAAAVDKVGQFGVCTAEAGPGTEVSLSFVEGMAYDRGYIVPHFVTNPEKMIVKYDQALVFVTAKSLTEQNDVLPLLALAAQRELPLLLVCENLSGQALQVIITNMARGAVRVVATKLPGFSSFVEPMTRDLCALTGATYFDAYKDVKEAHQGSFGVCKNLEVGSMYTKFLALTESDVEESTDAMKDLVANIKAQVSQRLAQAQEQLKSYQGNNDEWAISQTQERIARLGSGAALIQVGARTELEQQERLYRVEDAIQACRAAKEEGIVPGAGNVQLQLAKTLSPNAKNCPVANQVLIKALRALFDQLRTNCEAFDVPDAEHTPVGDIFNAGINPENGALIDLYQVGIIDPAKVTRCALENAISVASIMLRTAGAVVEEPDKPTDKTALQIAEEEHNYNLANIL